MKTARLGGLLLALSSLFVAAGCSAAAEEDAAPAQDAITSNDGSPLEMELDTVVVAGAETTARDAVLAQLEYLQGHLITGVGGNAQFGHAKLTDVTETKDGAKKTVKAHVVVPAIWPKDKTPPTSYDVTLPLDTRDLPSFNRKYDGTCGTNEYGLETFWHDWNPGAATCKADDADVSRATAKVRKNPKATQGKYLEYDRVWEDDRLDVIGVFGIISSFTEADDGVKEMNTLLAEARRGLTGEKKEDLGTGSTVLRATRITGKKTIDGRSRDVSFTTILVNNVFGAGEDFDAIYGPATKQADYVYYGGHSELGQNIRALAKRAEVAKGKYQVAYLNGCQTFGYLGTTWNDKKREANGAASDPEGTRDLDIFVTGLPAYDDNGRSMLSIVKAMQTPGTPRTVNQILNDFSSWHLNVVFGEDDNAFAPR